MTKTRKFSLWTAVELRTGYRKCALLSNLAAKAEDLEGEEGKKWQSWCLLVAAFVTLENF